MVYPVVDSHAHIFTTKLRMVQARRYTPDRDATITDYLEMLRRNAVEYGVLVQPSFLGTDNQYMLSALLGHPTRLRGVAVVDPNIGTEDLLAFHAAGIVGIRLNLIGRSIPDLASEDWSRLLDFVHKHDWHIELHATARYLPELVAPLLARGCKIVVDHFGRPDASLGVSDPGFQYLLKTSETGLVWVKLSAPYRLPSSEDCSDLARRLSRELLGAFSPGRLVWGSDWPHSEHSSVLQKPAQLAQFRELFDSEDIIYQVLSSTPLSLFHFQRQAI
ncbi:amidohydrolase family protein [Castellaniella sp. WN]